MKNVFISYSNANGVESTVKARTQDKATRKMTNHNGSPIQSSQSGRLSVQALLTRCAEHGITLNFVKVVVNGKARFTYESANGAPTPKPIAKPEPIKIAEPNEPIQVIIPEPIAIAEPEPEPEVQRSQSSSNGKASSEWKWMAQNIEPHLDIPEPKQSIDVTAVQALIDKAVDEAISTINVPLQVTVNNAVTNQTIELGIQHDLFPDILECVDARENCMIVGGAGGGKTYSAEQVARALDLPFYAISVCSMSTKTDFMGYMQATGDYVPTLFRKALEFGGVFLLDEIDNGNSNVLAALNMALSSDRAAFPDKMVDKHKDFVLIAGANTYGHGGDTVYVGRNQLDGATLDRFTIMDMEYDEKLELVLAGQNQERWTKYVQKVRKQLNKVKGNYIISPRASIKGAKFLERGVWDIDKVSKYVLFKGMTDEDIETITNGINY